jgi:UDP-N-acetylmuramyl pentapeptide phosphotransferase/UDP-N-acetylglucosamine-1-phosphate transferase
MLTKLTIVVLSAFAIAFVLTPIFRNVAHRRGLLDVPNDASSHKVPTPRNGGFAVFLGIVAAFPWALGAAHMSVLFAMTLMTAALPAIDEFRPLPRALRFVIQLGMAVATVFVLELTNLSISLPFAGRHELGALATVLAIVWLVGVVNTYNFMDGLNGLASTAAIICGATQAILFLQHHDTGAAIVALGLAAAAAGFVPWNLPSGSVFMGDVGSATLGFLLAVLSLRLIQDGVPVLPAILPVASFCSDAFITIVRRAAAGERFFATRHRSHYYQWLNQQGWSHTGVTALWALLVVAASIAALAYGALPEVGRVTSIASVVILHATVFVWVASRQRPA